MTLLHEAQLRHAQFYASRLLELSNRQIDGGEVLNDLDLEWDQTLVARERALGIGEDDRRALEVVNDLALARVLLRFRLPLPSWMAWLEAGYSAAVALNDSVSALQHRRALGVASYEMGDLDRAYLYHNEALTIGREVGEPVLHGEEADHLARVLMSLGRHTEALELWEEALTVFGQSENGDGEAVTLCTRGTFWWREGHLDRATADFERAVEIFREVSPHKAPAALGHLAGVYAQRGETERALSLSVDALEEARRRSDRRGEQELLMGLGGVQRIAGDLDGALDSFISSAGIAAELGDHGAESSAVHWIGVVQDQLGTTSAPVEAAQRRLELARSSADHPNEHRALIALGEAYEAVRNFEAAEQTYIDAYRLAEFRSGIQPEGTIDIAARKYRVAAAQALLQLGDLYLHLGRPLESAARLRQGAALLENELDRSLRSRIFFKLGTALIHAGHFEEAISAHTQQYAVSRALGDRSGEGLAIGMIATARAQQGRHQDALQLFDEAMAVHVESGNRHHQMMVLGDRGRSLIALGDLRAATISHQQALELARELRDRPSEGLYMWYLASDCAAAGDLAGAVALSRDAEAILQESNDPVLPFVRRSLAEWRARTPIVPVRANQSL